MISLSNSWQRCCYPKCQAISLKHKKNLALRFIILNDLLKKHLNSGLWLGYDSCALFSTVAPSGWGCMSILTWEVRWWSWRTTAPTLWTVSEWSTSTPATWTDTGCCTSTLTTGDVTITWGPANTGALVTGTATAPGSAPSGVSWISKDRRTVLGKCLLFALFHTLNKMASVLKRIQFCSCSLHLEGMFSQENVTGSWPEILTLIRGLNKILQAMTFSALRLKRYLL